MIDKPCLTPECKGRYTQSQGRSAGCARGLCGPCYQVARRLIKIRETTWRELEDLGLADTPVRKRVEKPTLFHLALKKRKEEAQTAED